MTFFLTELDRFNIKRLYLQDMIGLSVEEILDYKAWIKNTFDITAHDIDSWQNDKLFNTNEIIIGKRNYEIVHKTHTSDGYCKSPFYHVHIAWNGNVLYCTDFYDFSAGNVKLDTLENIFINQKVSVFARRY